MPAPTNLYEYYQSQGQALPSVQARQGIASQAGIQNYTGSGEQNTALLRYLTSSGTSTQNSNPVIQSGNIGTQPLNVPTPNPVPNVTNELATAMNAYNTQATQAQQGVDTLSNERNQLKSDYQVLLDQLTGQTADQQAQEQAQGIPQISKDIQDLMNTSRTQTAKYLQGIQNIETRPGIRTEVNAQSQFLNRQNAIDSMFTNSLISAKQGDLSNAQAQVDRAISLKYDPIKQQIQNKMQFLELNYQDLSRADQKLADAKSKQWEIQMKQIDKLQEQEKNIQSIAMEAAKNGASASVLAKISKATSVNEATTLASGYFQDPLDVKLKKLQIQKAQLDLSSSETKDKKIVKINGTDYIQNKDGTYSLPVLPSSSTSVQAQQAAQDKLSTINSLIGGKGIAGAVGANVLARNKVARFLTGGAAGAGAKNNFIAGVEKVVSDLTLDKLISSKAQGATFGALSEGEMRILAGAASKIGTWQIKDKNGKVTGYSASEKDFTKELETIRQYTERALVGTSQADSYLNLIDSVLQSQNNPYSQAGYILE